MQKHNQISTSSTLFSIEDVSGATVQGYLGEIIGKIDRLLFDRQSGRVAFAIIDAQGALSSGTGKVTIPWGKLYFDAEIGGYCANLTQEQIEHAPQFDEDDEPSRVWERRTLDYFRQPYYWA